MKCISHLGFVVLLLAGAGGLTSLGQSVSVDFDKTANFAAYKTYAWIPGTPAASPLMDQRIIAAIDAQMKAKGMQKVDAPASADLEVLYHGAVGTETQLNTMSMGGIGWGARWGGGMSNSTTTVEKIPLGQLTVDIGDAKTRKLLWMGTASDTLSNNADKNSKKIEKAAAKMFKKFPPPAK